MSCNTLLDDPSGASPTPIDGYALQTGLLPRILAAWRFLTHTNNRYRVPEEVECCSRCWCRIPQHERVKIVVMIRDRQLGGVVNLIAGLVHEGLFKDLEGRKKL